MCSPLFSLKHHEDSVVTGMARVHARSSKVQYPPDPGPQWICFICISDNHSRTKFDIFSGGDALSSYPEQIMVTSGLTQRPGPSDQGVNNLLREIYDVSAVVRRSASSSYLDKKLALKLICERTKLSSLSSLSFL